MKVKVSEKMLLDIKEILDRKGIRFWLWMGTFLGVYREGRLFPYDNDVDLAIFQEEKPQFDACAHVLIDKGFESLDGPEITRFRRGGEHVDFFWLSLYGSHRTWRRLQINSSAFDANTIKFLGLEWRILNEPEKWLKYIYGEGWEVPKIGAHLDELATPGRI